MMVSWLTTVPEFIIKTYGIRISWALLIICLPIMMTASCCVNSMRQPPLLHWNIVAIYAYISFKYPIFIFITAQHPNLFCFYITHAIEYYHLKAYNFFYYQLSFIMINFIIDVYSKNLPLRFSIQIILCNDQGIHWTWEINSNTCITKTENQ